MKLDKIIFSVVFNAIILCGMFPPAIADSGHGAKWSYEGETGPSHWGGLKEEFSLCKNGESQSPVNISEITKTEAPQLEIHYVETSLDVLNNGHTVQFNYQPGSFIKIGEKKFDLLQFHFHAPSEHIVKGKPLDMEMHLVHKNEQGELAVLGVFFIVAEKNSPLDSFWKHLPEKVNEPTKLAEIKVNAKDLLPENLKYFFYSGSLTTPPCSEGVRWNVLNQPLPVTESQLNSFNALVGDNARPTQVLNTRNVTHAE